MRPSFVGHVINGILAFIGTILFLKYYETFTSEQLVSLVLLLSIAYGVHAILHHYEEIYYDFNPYNNKWTIRNYATLPPIRRF